MNNIIANELEYNSTLNTIEELMDSDPEPNSEDGKKLQILTLFIKNYEKDLKILELPDPIEAIKFRMEQQNLKFKDLIPYIGSKSKVSEVLSRKRPLSIEMIRALSEGLGIPAKVLIKESNHDISENNIDWNKFPVKEIISRKWVDYPTKKIIDKSEDIVRTFIKQLNPIPQFSALYRSNQNIRSGRKMDVYSLFLWNIRIMIKASKINVYKKFNVNLLTNVVLKQLVQLSTEQDGPLKAIEFLLHLGIKVIIEPHLPKTYLDGAVLLSDINSPIIGLTLRFDRIDNFWFTLLHEIAHIHLHLNKNIEFFYDDLEVIDNENILEIQADEFAREILVPNENWVNSPASKLKSPQAAEYLAKELIIHPAIIAGKMRYEFNAYGLLNNLIGNKQVRKLFSEITWS